jgi:hypothetical protein
VETKAFSVVLLKCNGNIEDVTGTAIRFVRIDLELRMTT